MSAGRRIWIGTMGVVMGISFFAAGSIAGFTWWAILLGTAAWVGLLWSIE